MFLFSISSSLKKSLRKRENVLYQNRTRLTLQHSSMFFVPSICLPCRTALRQLRLHVFSPPTISQNSPQAQQIAELVPFRTNLCKNH